MALLQRNLNLLWSKKVGFGNRVDDDFVLYTHESKHAEFPNIWKNICKVHVYRYV